MPRRSGTNVSCRRAIALLDSAVPPRDQAAHEGRDGSKRRPTHAYPREVLEIDRQIADAIVAHAKRDHPDEACGVVAGPAGSDRPVRVVAVPNASQTPYTRYEFSSADLFALYRDLEDRGEEVVVVYHSHTHTEAYPSQTDLTLAGEPGAHYVLVSTRAHGAGEGPVEFRSFRIVDGQITEEDVSIVEGDPA